MSIAQFNAFVWRSYRLRRYHWIKTSLEFGLPILIIYFLVDVHKFEAIKKQKKETVYPSVPRHNFVSVTKKIKLYYAPSNFVTKNFMGEIQSNFASVHGLASEADLELTLMNNSKYFGIYFENIISKQSLPNKLKYKLKNSGQWKTQDLYSEIDTNEMFRKDSKNEVQLFVSIQLLLNENFIKRKMNISVSTEFEFEWFPHPWNDDFSSTFLIFIFFVIKITMLLMSLQLLNDIIEEKTSGMKELIKLAGLNERTIWFSWFVHVFVISFISFSIVAILVASGLNGAGIARFFIFWMFLTLYCVANISFSLMFSSIFQRTEIAVSVFWIVCIVQQFGIYWLSNNVTFRSLLKWLAISVDVTFFLGFQEINYHEMRGNELTWSSVMISKSSEHSVSLLFCFCMLLFDTFLYLFLTYYITSINPGKFGTPESPLFILKSLTSKFLKNHIHPLKDEMEMKKKEENEYIEASPPGVGATLRMKNLHKKFGPVHAVRGVNLNIYPNELTALLGHNGAGKTATISVLTGQTSPKAGTIYYENKDIFEDMTSFRKNLGICPQENRTMPYLTVMEHLIFFGKLREASFKTAVAEANEYLTMMEMHANENELVDKLSGGMKRKLCISIALMGKAKNLRRNRTIIFTTHNIKEADVLGDRVAIMSNGLIVCYGTPMFLKKVYGTGYELTIIKNNMESKDVDEVIKKILPNASRERETSKKLAYRLPLTETEKFPILFKNLESKMKQSRIESFGVSVSTVEDIFLKVNEKFVNDQNTTRKTTDTSSVFGSRHIQRIKGIPLYTQQITALLKKKYVYTSRNLLFVLYNICMPILGGFPFWNPSNNYKHLREPTLDLSMTAYPGSTVVLRNNISDLNFGKHLSEYVAEKGGSLVNVKNSPIETELLKLAEDILKYDKNYISAFELNSNTTKILSNPSLTHSLPITVTTYTNVVLRNLTNSKLYEIVTINHPIQDIQRIMPDEMCGSFEMSVYFYNFWILFLGFLTIMLPVNIVAFVNMERIDGFQHVQFTSNVSPLIYWLGTFLFDATFFILVTFGRVCVCKISDHSDFLGFDTNLGVFISLAIAYGISGILFIYTVDFLFKTKEIQFGYSFFHLIGTFFVFIFYFIKFLVDGMFLHFVEAVILVIPPLNFLLLFIKFMAIFNSNAHCSFCSEAIRPICEAKLKKKSYFVFASEENRDGLLLGMIFFMIDIALYSTLLYCINMGYIQYWLNSLKNLKWNATDPTNEDQGDNDVQEEFKKVQKFKKDESSECNKVETEMNKIVLLVDGLRKIYFKWFEPFVAVSSANFIVEPGECFGLLGTNGAGKTTTFKMLSAEIIPTLGNATIKNIKLSTQKGQYLSMVGYCPQTNSFLEELTGKEMLTMIATFKGIPKNEIETVVHEWINILGLNEYQNHRCATYSGGNKRKLCAAMSLIGNPVVVLLDEPTSGIDLISRHNLYNVMVQNKRNGQAVVFASHSVDECEVICDRLTIMDSGVMKSIGTIQHLKKLYAQGFSILIKLNNIPNFDNEVVELKGNMLKAFTEAHCILKNEYMGILHYRITDKSLLWSVFFEKMEGMKSLHQNLVAEYLLAETTLEEIFSSFAKNYSTED